MLAYPLAREKTLAITKQRGPCYVLKDSSKMQANVIYLYDYINMVTTNLGLACLRLKKEVILVRHNMMKLLGA